jgi:hypothetical protein
MKNFSWLPKFRSVPLLATTSPHTPSTSLSSIDDELLDKVAGGAKPTGGFFSYHSTSGAVTTPSGNTNTQFSSNQHSH